MNNQIVAVWVKNGCGKSTFAAALARALSEHFSTVLLAGADVACPAFAVWGADNEEKISLGAILDRSEITAGYLRQNIVTEPAHASIGLLGYLAGESIEQYNPIKSEAAEAFFGVAKEIAEVTIADCGLPQSDAFSYEAINGADIIITLCEANRKGIAFFTSMSPVFSAIEGIKSFLVCAKARSDSPVKDVESKTGRKFDYFMPYTQEAIKKFYDCKLFDRYSGMTGQELARIAAAIKEVAECGC